MSLNLLIHSLPCVEVATLHDESAPHAWRLGCFVGAFEQDQHVWRVSPFQAPQRPHRQVFAAAGPNSGRKRLVEIAAPQSQQTDRSASFVTPQWGQSQLRAITPPSRRFRRCQSTDVKAKVTKNRKRSAVGRRSSTEETMRGCRGYSLRARNQRR